MHVGQYVTILGFVKSNVSSVAGLDLDPLLILLVCSMLSTSSFSSFSCKSSSVSAITTNKLRWTVDSCRGESNTVSTIALPGCHVMMMVKSLILPNCKAISHRIIIIGVSI